MRASVCISVMVDGGGGDGGNGNNGMGIPCDFDVFLVLAEIIPMNICERV